MEYSKFWRDDAGVIHKFEDISMSEIFEFTPDPTFEIGDIVTLLTGGPHMTVLGVCDDCGNTDVAWFDGDSLEIVTLPEVALEFAE